MKSRISHELPIKDYLSLFYDGPRTSNGVWSTKHKRERANFPCGLEEARVRGRVARPFVLAQRQLTREVNKAKLTMLWAARQHRRARANEMHGNEAEMLVGKTR